VEKVSPECTGEKRLCAVRGFGVFCRVCFDVAQDFMLVFEKVSQFAPSCAMADFEEASVSAFQRFFHAGRRRHRLLVSLRAVAVSQIQKQVNADSAHANGLQQLIACVLCHWICKRSIGLERLSVRHDHNHTNIIL